MHPGGAGAVGARRRSASASRAPKTIPSSSELEASRLAPCTPVQAASPAAQSPGSAVAPHRSVTTPPERWWAAGAMGSQSTAGSSPMAASEAAMVGNRCVEALEAGGVEPQVVDALRRPCGRPWPG